MRVLAITILAVLAAAAPVAVRAADPLVVAVSTDSAVPLAESEFDWNGFYAGVYGVTQPGPVGGVQYGLGLDLGVNARFEFVLVGAEVAYHGLAGGTDPTSYLQATARVGVAATDDVILYAAGGLGVDLGPRDETDVLIGGGVEMAVTDNLSLRGQYLHGVPLGGANPKEQFSFGANFHF